MDRLDELKNKYKSAFDAIQREGVRLSRVNMQGDKLFIQGTAPSESVKNDIWNQIKAADASYSDLVCDLSVDTSLAPQQSQAAAASAGSANTSARTYTVQSGDTLSKIAEQFYGEASEYNKIFEANRDKLSDPNHVRAGQELTIPN